MLMLITYIHVGRQNCFNDIDGVNVIFASLHKSNLLKQRRGSCRGAKNDLHFDLTLRPCRANKIAPAF
jgi:hypothetical protein